MNQKWQMMPQNGFQQFPMMPQQMPMANTSGFQMGPPQGGQMQQWQNGPGRMMPDLGWGNPNMQMPQGFDPNQAAQAARQGMRSGMAGGMKGPAQGLLSQPPKMTQQPMQRVSPGLYRNGQGQLVRR